MVTREQRASELYSSGLVDSIKGLFVGRNVNIPEEYYVLIADYFDSLDEVKDSMIINPLEIAKRLPSVISNIQEANLNGIYGITNENGISIEQSMSYEDKKLYFFHELTHALQTSTINGIEHCAFYNGHDGMFLTEGSTQYTAEILYNISNGTDIKYRPQPGTVRGQSGRTPYSPLSEYQYNGDILMLLSKSMDLPLPQVLSLAYKPNGRETLKSIYESMDGNQGKFDGLMQHLEQIYSIDKLLIAGYGNYLQSETPELFRMQDGTPFRANLNTYNTLMNKVEREIASSFVRNHDTEYVVNNYTEIVQYLTTPELKNDFLAVIQNLKQELEKDGVEPTIQENESLETTVITQESKDLKEKETKTEARINEFGEVVRIDGQDEDFQISSDIPTFEPPTEQSLSLKQKIARMLQNNQVLMKLPFIKNFAEKQLNVLPPPTQEDRTPTTISSRTAFVNYLTNNGKYRNLPPIQRMSDPEKIEAMKRKMEQQQLNER